MVRRARPRAPHLPRDAIPRLAVNTSRAFQSINHPLKKRDAIPPPLAPLDATVRG
jgi:hypothetical protein